MKAAQHLSDPFTVEFDYFPKPGGYDSVVVFFNAGDEEKRVHVGPDTSTEGLENLPARGQGEQPARGVHKKQLSGTRPEFRCVHAREAVPRRAWSSRGGFASAKIRGFERA